MHPGCPPRPPPPPPPQLLRLLLSRGLLLDELSPRAYSSVHVDDEGGDGSASWSGFCRVPPAEQGAPLLPVRRIDVKVGGWAGGLWGGVAVVRACGGCTAVQRCMHGCAEACCM